MTTSSPRLSVLNERGDMPYVVPVEIFVGSELISEMWGVARTIWGLSVC